MPVHDSDEEANGREGAVVQRQAPQPAAPLQDRALDSPVERAREPGSGC